METTDTEEHFFFCYYLPFFFVRSALYTVFLPGFCTLGSTGLIRKLKGAKILGLRIPRGIARWVCDFLMDRRQRVKLSSDCFSEWGTVPSGVPQGTKLGPWLFILMINDLHPSGSDVWKYVDDTTLAEVVPRGGQSGMQVAVNAVEQWSTINKLQLNADKCKELVIDFKKVKHHFDAVTVNSQELERVDSVKLLGVTITNTLQWNCHVLDVIQKANKRIYFLILLKRVNSKFMQFSLGGLLYMI